MKKAACRVLLLFGFLALAQCFSFGTNIHIDKKMTWSEAREYCREQNTDLSSINSEEEELEIATLLSNVLLQIWIGLYRDASGSWKWTSGANASHFNWLDRVDATKKNCVTKTPRGWRPMSCETKRQFLCFQSSLVLVTENKSWEEAVEHCRHSNMELMSLPSQSAVVAALQAGRTAQTSRLWTSLRYLGNSWLWVDRSIHTSGTGYQAWETLQCPAWSHHCGALSLEGQLLDSWDCADKLNFLCYSKNTAE